MHNDYVHPFNDEKIGYKNISWKSQNICICVLLIYRYEQKIVQWKLKLATAKYQKLFVDLQ